ncbi:cytochrome P450 [Biscogniauxia mediterranea]|nr:cytochrome P450 [Biscogniauxia mediterranea]
MPSIVEDSHPYVTNFTTVVTQKLPWQEMVGSRFSYYVAIVTVLFCVWLSQPTKQKCRVAAPFYKASRIKWMFNADALIQDSYSKFRDCVYQIKSTEGVRTLIPANLVGELKGLPEDTLSAKKAISEAMLSEYTKLSAGAHSDTLSLVLKTKTTAHVGRMVPTMKKELEHILATEFPECQEWTPFVVQPFMIRVIARLSGGVFVGPAISRTEEWMDVSINFAVTAFIAVIKLQFFPTWLRPVVAHFVTELTTIRKDLEKAEEMLTPIIEQRIRDFSDAPGCDKPDDFIQWLLDALPEDDKRDYQIQSKMQLLLSASSIHTTSNLVTDCIYDLAIHQDMQEILREEANEVFKDEDDWNKKDSVQKLTKMDSFIRESQRLSGNVTSFIRKVMKPIDLSDGTHLPAGTNLLTPLAGIARDERYYPDAGVFDGLRFWKLRQQQQQQHNHDHHATEGSGGSRGWQFTSIGDTNMNFGLGRHACPGRFFAAAEIKMTLAHLLLRYDVRMLPEGQPPSRPRPNMFMMTKSPSSTAEVLFRRRSRRSAT